MKPPSKTEVARSREWREALGLSVDDLAQLTGWTRAAVYRFENGAAWSSGSKHKVSARAWQRWKMACGSVHCDRQHVHCSFNWDVS